MKTQTPVPELMTFSAVARKLDVPLPKASRLLSKGVLRPDYRIGERVFPGIKLPSDPQGVSQFQSIQQPVLIL